MNCRLFEVRRHINTDEDRQTSSRGPCLTVSIVQLYLHPTCSRTSELCANAAGGAWGEWLITLLDSGRSTKWCRNAVDTLGDSLGQYDIPLGAIYRYV